MEIRDQMMALQPELESIQRQNEEMLRNQNLQGDMLEQVKDSVDAALAFVNPMQSEGLSGRAASEFMAKESRFQLALLNGDFGGAQTALDEMKGLSPHGNRVKICEMALKTSQKKFDDAEQVSRSLSPEARQNKRVQKATHSLTSLTQAGRRPPVPPPSRGGLNMGALGNLCLLYTSPSPRD